MKGRFILVAYLFVLFFCVFAFVSRGALGLDTAIRMEVTRSILAGKGFTAGSRGRIVRKGPDGSTSRYSVYGVGQSVLLIPFEVAIGRPVLALARGPHEREVADTAVSLAFFPAFGALCMVLLFMLAKALGNSERAAWRLVLIVGFCSPMFVYGSDPQEVTQVLALELAGLLLVCRSRATSRAGLLATGIACFWATTVIRPNMAVDAVVLSAYAVLCARSYGLPGGVLKGMIALAAAAGVSAGWYLLYNQVRFGTPFTNAYVLLFRQRGVNPFSVPFWQGFLGPFVSLDKSIFLHCPLLLAAVVVALRNRRRESARLHWVGWIVFVATAATLARYIAWAGDFSSGPRLEVHAVVLCLVGLLPLLEGARPGMWLRLLLIASFVVQVAQKSFDPGLEIHQNPYGPAITAELAPRYAGGRWTLRFTNVGRKISGELESTLTPAKRQTLGEYADYLTQWDFFWVRAWHAGRNQGFAQSMLAAAFAFGAVVAACLIRRKLNESPRAVMYRPRITTCG